MQNRRKNDASIRPKVLIVDDDARNRYALSEILEEIECDVIEADSGEQTLEIAISEELALILLDVQMPNMDGFEVASLLKKHKKTKDIPLVFVTAYSKDQKHIQQGHLLGGSDYIVKPIDPVVLVSKVLMYLDHYFNTKGLESQLKHLNLKNEDLKKIHQELESKAKYDHLTGLHNRSNFENILDRTIQTCSENSLKFALLYMDLDNFKTINDKYGHDSGDKLLKSVSMRLRKVLRATDIFNYKRDESYISRLGGDEFAILLINLERPEQAGKVARRIIESIDEIVLVAEHEFLVGVSIGIAMFPEAGVMADDLCKHADQAMYLAKKSGKNSYRYYTDQIQKSHEVDMRLETSIKRCIDDGEFYMVYQPIYDLKTMRIAGIEALCRLNHSELGEIPPDHFIAVAEEAKLIVSLGNWIITQVFKDISSMLSQISPRPWIAINISMQQFYNVGFINFIEGAMQQFNINPAEVEIELTESLLMSDLTNADEAIYTLRRLGIGISIDDFGVGHSSLKRLKELPITTLKIDRSFMDEISNVTAENNLIVTMVELAHSMDIRVVAEGIEMEDQLKFLVDNGCDLGQGFLLSKPMPIEEIICLLRVR